MADKLQKVTFGKDLSGYATGKGNGVIVLQEWWGVTEEVKLQALKIHENTGLAVLVPDLYHGKIGVDAEEATHLMGNLDWGRAVEEIGAAAQYLRDQGAKKIGVIGFCMGGALSLLAAQNGFVDASAPFYGTPDPKAAQNGFVDASAPFYGTPDPKAAQPEKIKCPVQAHVGEDDSMDFAKKEVVQGFVKKITDAGNSHATLFTYPGEGHAFMNDRNHKDIDAKMKTGGLPTGSANSQQQAWSRVFDFFRSNLQ